MVVIETVQSEATHDAIEFVEACYGYHPNEPFYEARMTPTSTGRQSFTTPTVHTVFLSLLCEFDHVTADDSFAIGYFRNAAECSTSEL